MDQKKNIRVIEEEKFGWTILSTVPDSEFAACEENLVAQQEADLDLLPDVATDECVTTSDTHGDNPSATESKGAEEDEESDDAEAFTHAEEDDDADDELDEYGFDEGGDDGEQAKVFPFGDAAREFMWDPEPRREASEKEILVEQQAGQKQGVLWRVSLVATLGFFGWAVLSGLSGGGKNVRCLKLHPCSIKEGETCVSTL